MDTYADGNGLIDYSPYQQAIKSIESSGGNYGLVGPVTANGDRAYGAYQVMGSNVPDWTQKHFGTRLTPAQFLQNKAAQDAVFNGEFGSYLQQHGNPQDAASMWFSGRPLAQAANSSDGYINTRQYVDKFNKALGFSGDAASGADDNSDDDSDKAALSANNTLGKGALQQIMEGEQPNKLNTIGAALSQAGASIAGISSPAQASTLNAQAAAIRKDGQSTYKTLMGPDGTIYRIDDQGGIQAVKTGSGKASYQVVMGKDASGMPTPIGKFDKNGGVYTPFQSASSAQAGTQIGGDPTLTGQDRYNSMSPEDQRMADAFNEGRGPPVTSLTLRNPKFAKQWEGAQAVFPNLDVNTAAARKKFQQENASSSPTSFGGLMDRSQIALDQLDKTLDSYGELGNTSSMFGSYASNAENRVRNVGVEKGRIMDRLETNASNAASDINSVQNGGRGAAAERENIKNLLNLPYASNVEQSGAVQAHIDAIKSAIETRFAHEKQQVGEEMLQKDPRYQSAMAKLTEVQKKADALYKGDFSYVKGGATQPAKGNKPSLDEIFK